MANPKRPRHDRYTVGWICALHEELTAAKAMLDERHERLSQPDHDNNSYILGEISGHNLVIACLPSGEYGTNAAASVATQMRSTFPEIQFLLMVGIGGGVPETADIRLGDVVVSAPTGEYGGVVQYDLGKTVADGRLVHTGMLNRPPQRLLTAVGNLRSERAMGFDRMSGFLRDMVNKYPEMANFQYPASASDNLYQTSYGHSGGDKPCDEACDQGMLVVRSRRPSKNPQIYYGLIASGNQVIKHAASRERLAKQYNILCFEMEAAGLMNQFPCLVIRGICDYSDSHKNKKWQCYAAATAAAYAKELLGMVQASQPAETISIEDLEVPAESNYPDDSSLTIRAQPKWEVTRYRLQKSRNTAFFERLSSYDPHRTCQDYLRRRCPDTTKWTLNHPLFKDWVDGKTYPCLWVSGKIGCGKTLATSTVVYFLETVHPESHFFVAHYFYSHSNRAGLSAKSLFESFSKQILGYLTYIDRSYPKDVLKRIKALYTSSSLPATLSEVLENIFLPCCRAVPDVIYVIDGLDECERSEVIHVFGTIRKMIHESNSRVLISARDGIDVVQAIPLAITISIADQGNYNDIRRFINWKIGEKSQDRPLTEDAALLQDIKARLLEKADYMFLWVELQLEMLWEDCYTDADIRIALENLPKTLSETYDRCISRINTKQGGVARRVLYWVCVAIKPFNAFQLQEALAMDTETGTVDAQRMLPPREIVKLCCHLVIWDTNDNIRLAHASVYQFLQERSAGIEQLWSEYTMAEARLELAELCLTRLLPLCAGGILEHYKGPDGLTNSGSILQTIKKHIPYSEFLGFSRPRSAQIPWPPRPPQGRAMTEALAFFQFAKYHWAPLTDSIDRNSPLWGRFRRVALVQNPSNPIHPWEPLGDSVDSHFVARLAWAIAHKHRPLFSLLLGPDRPQLHKGIFNVPLHHHNNLPLLHLAARSNFPDAVDEILKGSNYWLTDAKERLALHHAAETGAIDAMTVLLKHLPSWSYDREDIDGYSPLHLAIMNNRHGMVSLLIALGEKTSAVDKAGKTPLMHAVRYCDAKMVQLLIPNPYGRITVYRKAIVNMGDPMKVSALHIAAERLDPQIISLLLGSGAKLDARDKEGLIPLDVSAESFLRANQLSVPRWPVSRVLSHAIKLGNAPVVDCLLQLGALPNLLDYSSPERVSPLELSLCGGRFDITELLIMSSSWRDYSYRDMLEGWREEVLFQAYKAAKAINYSRIFHAAQANDMHQLPIPVYREGRLSAVPSVIATLACMFGHGKVIKSLHDFGYKLEVDHIMKTAERFHLGSLAFNHSIHEIPNTQPGVLTALFAIAKMFDRADIEVALLNIRFESWRESDRTSGSEQEIASAARM